MKTVLAFLCLILLAAWGWQAGVSDSLMAIEVPRWIAGSATVSYSVSIHKTQIRPWGTIWRTTYGPWSMTSVPVTKP
jgi:hypothetical protein